MINVDDLLKEVLDEVIISREHLDKLAEMLITPKIADKLADIVLNSAMKDPLLYLATTSKAIVPMCQAIMVVGFEMGRLYGRSQLMDELAGDKK